MSHSFFPRQTQLTHLSTRTNLTRSFRAGNRRCLNGHLRDPSDDGSPKISRGLTCPVLTTPQSPQTVPETTASIQPPDRRILPPATTRPAPMPVVTGNPANVLPTVIRGPRVATVAWSPVARDPDATPAAPPAAVLLNRVPIPDSPSEPHHPRPHLRLPLKTSAPVSIPIPSPLLRPIRPVSRRNAAAETTAAETTAAETTGDLAVADGVGAAAAVPRAAQRHPTPDQRSMTLSLSPFALRKGVLSQSERRQTPAGHQGRKR